MNLLECKVARFVVVLLLPLVATLAAAAWATAADVVPVAPIKAVVLIDESGSQTPASVENERDAAALLAQSEIAPMSKIEIAGFGSSNGPGQSAVVPYCKWITLSSSESRDEAARCASHAHRRSPKEGDDTDHVAALSYAVDQLSRTGAGATPVIFLLTDGLLDVCHSPQYGKTCDSRTRNATDELVSDVLPRAKRRRVQIWPLGFGLPQNVRLGPLQRFASGAAGANIHCDLAASARPHAVVVGDSTRVLSRLLGLLGRARCAHANDPTRGQLRQTGSISLKVSVPAIATDGTLSVNKLDPTLRVTFFDPDGKQAPAHGIVDGQSFELSGENGRIEALRVQNPKAGKWKVRIENPAHHPSRAVDATVIWAGALEARISVRPNVPQAGGKGIVDLHLVTRYGAVKDASALAGLSATAKITGKFGSLDIDVRDDGRSPDERANDGVFSSGFSVPGGTGGCITVVGRIGGDGVASDRRPFYGCPPPVDTDATFESSWPSRTEAGSTLTGAVVVSNSGGAQQARLLITDLSDDAYATISPSSVSLIQGRQRYPFKVTIASSTPHGDITGRVRLINAGGKLVAESFLATTVVGKQSLPSRYWWVIVLAALLVAWAIAAAVLRRRAKRRGLRVDGLTAVLDGQGVGGSVVAPGGYVFLLRYLSDGDGGARLAVALSADDANIEIRRQARGGGLSFDGLGRVEQVRVGAPILLDDHVSLLIGDSRDGSPPRRRRASGEETQPSTVISSIDDPEDILA